MSDIGETFIWISAGIGLCIMTCCMVCCVSYFLNRPNGLLDKTDVKVIKVRPHLITIDH